MTGVAQGGGSGCVHGGLGLWRRRQWLRAQARSCGCPGAAVAVPGRCGHGYWRLKLRLLEAQGLGGNWYEGVWSSSSPFYKPVEQLNGLGSRRVTISPL